MKKRRSKEIKSPNKGTRSALILSVGIHAGLFLLAGSLTVFILTKPPPQAFKDPVIIKRPKQPLIKPQVPVKQSKPVVHQVITTKNPSTMPRIEIPPVDAGGGLANGVFDGLEINIEEETESLFGREISLGNDLAGTYYDFKFPRGSTTYRPIDVDNWRAIFKKFIDNDWDPSVFSGYYRSPKKIYAPCLFLPPSISAMAPVAFGMPDHMTSGGLWIIHYKGQIAHKDGITFRFWVSVDDSLAIRINKKVVVAASFINADGANSRFEPMFGTQTWLPTDPDSGKYTYGVTKAIVGDWITLEPGELYDMEVVAGDNPHQGASFIVMVQEKGVEYERGAKGGPLLPIFRTAELSRRHIDKIYRLMPEGELCVTNGPLFKDF